MPSHISWLLPSRVLYTYEWGKPDLTEFQAVMRENYDRISEGTAPVHSLVNALDITEYPRSLSTIIDAVRQRFHPNTGWVIFVTNNAIDRFFAPMIVQIGAQYHRVRTFKTMTEALEFLSKIDPTIGAYPIDELKGLCREQEAKAHQL